MTDYLTDEEYAAENPAFYRALVQLNANAKFELARRERKRSDTRLKFLAGEMADAPITAHGFGGFAQVVEAIRPDSSANHRRRRAKSLWIARSHQINRDHRSARRWLEIAAEQRINEIFHRCREGAEASIVRLDGALLSIQAAE